MAGFLIAVLVTVLTMPISPVTALLAAAASIIHAIRLAGWYTHKYWAVPLLWVLHLGYGWIVIGFLLTALAALKIVTPSLALHAYTAGAIGTLTLGMMARVSLGHTGRMLEPAKLIELSFALISLAAAVRVLLPLLLPGTYGTAVTISGLFWMAAFTIFTLIYTPILVQSRVDGKPG